MCMGVSLELSTHGYTEYWYSGLIQMVDQSKSGECTVVVCLPACYSLYHSCLGTRGSSRVSTRGSLSPSSSPPSALPSASASTSRSSETLTCTCIALYSTEPACYYYYCIWVLLSGLCMYVYCVFSIDL